MPQLTKSLLLLIACILLSQTAGIIGSFFTMESIQTWYITLTQPRIAPPSWVFAPVWISLYTMMGTSLFLVIRNGFKTKEIKVAATIFIFQLILNTLWSLVFFGNKNLQSAFLIIIVLLLSILMNIYSFYKVKPGAAYLLLPYLAWVSFASVLNYQFWMLNR